MLGHDLTLKCNELCLIGNRSSQGGEDGRGLYARDTRYLSDLTLSLGEDIPMTLLTLQESSISSARMVFTNMLPIGKVQSHQLLLQATLTLSDRLEVALALHNYSREQLAVTLTVGIAADFRDMFDVRGYKLPDNVATQSAVVEAGSAVLSARASDGVSLSTHVSWSGEATPMSEGSLVSLSWPLDMSAGDEYAAHILITPQPVGTPLQAPPADDAAHLFTPAATFATGNAELDRFLNQCDRDLAMLQTSFPEGVIPAAGIPWFIAPFGRDSLITSLQTMHRYPYRAQETLRVLAALQGERVDPFREEQPGKIAHEMRYGEYARSGQIPHTPYFGSIDSTPLFMMTLVACDAVLPDDAFFAEMQPHAERAFAWIEQYGDQDGDGLIEFAGTESDPTHISQQGWKDSFDSLHFADGREVEGPIALIEPQAYVFAAYAGYADALERRGHDGSSYRRKAEQLRETIERLYWLEADGFYAQALDGHKQPVDAISSNVGHLLFCGVASDERAARVASRIMAADMNGGWGTRTLSTAMADFNPLSYHNGTVWPHDVSLAMAGLARYGYHDAARTLAQQLVQLASHDPRFRLAELYGVFENDGNAPIPYPVSCSPQAWAADAGMLVAQVLGIA